MYEKWGCLDKKASLGYNYVEFVCGFMPNYLQVALYFVDRESYNKKESMLPL